MSFVRITSMCSCCTDLQFHHNCICQDHWLFG